MSLNVYLEDLVPSQIAGIQFYAKSLSTEKGNKLVVNELPNGGRVIEFFGKNEGVLNLEGCIEAWKYKNLEDALYNKQEVQYLSIFQEVNMPVFVQRIKKTETDSKLGQISFSIDLLQSEISSSITKTSALNILKNAKQNASLTNLQKLTNFYKVANGFLLTATSTIAQALGTIQNITQTINTVQANIESLNNQISSIQSTLTNLILAPVQLADSIKNLVANFSNTFTTLDDNILAIIDLAYNSQPTPIESTSQYVEDLTKPNNIFQSYLISECILAYSTIAIEKQFTYQYEVDKEIKNIQLLQNTTLNFSDTELKSQTNNILNMLVNHMKQLNNIKTKKEIKIDYFTSFRLLCYEIYGDLDNLDLLKTWNLDLSTKDAFIPQDSVIIYYE